MSIIYCEKHDRRWDSDRLEECPECENEPKEAAQQVGVSSQPQTISKTIAESPAVSARAFPDCVKCGLEARLLLHKFCTHAECPVRKERRDD